MQVSKLDRQYAVAGYVMLAPAILVVALITIFPIGYSIWMSLNNIQSTFNGFQFTFNGLTNYGIVFANQQFWQALVFTLVYAVITVIVELVL
ncbi:MAG: sugar ABC transporter permease, partial [Firmicutes bacterium]|nr:sugar ABC transporter permease [Bacillota bacterium]